MRKNFFLLAVVILTALAANAELSQSVVATLTHGSTITTFSGGNALKDAHNAAVDGDAIVLSPGTFNAVNITKAITLRGAGAAAISLPDSPIAAGAATYITGDMSINIESTTHKLTIEGCQFNNNVSFLKAPETSVFKTHFNKIARLSNNVVSIIFTHCRITFAGNETKNDLNQNTNLLNSAIAYDSYFNPYIKATNCWISGKNSYQCFMQNGDVLADGLLKNCIIYQPYNNNGIYLTANCTAYYCIVINPSSTGWIQDFFRHSNNGTNQIETSNSLVPSNNWPYVLTETAQTTYLGNDGTQVGIHGGALPFDPVPDNLLVTTCNIAPKTTADGKLSIEIKVSPAK